MEPLIPENSAVQSTPTESSLQELRVRVAELCGWTGVQVYNGHVYGSRGLAVQMPIRNYCNDLNACAEFEKTLTIEQRRYYVHHLMRLNGNLPSNHVYPEEIYDIITATAEQRAIAFVATMEASVPSSDAGQKTEQTEGIKEP